MINHPVDPVRDREIQAKIDAERARVHLTERVLAYQERRAAQEFRLFTFKLTELVWLAFGVLEGLIGLRILLRLLAANPGNLFATFIYGVTDLFVFPFQGLTAQPAAEGYVLEIPSIIAMFVYALLAWTIARLIWVLLYKPRGVP